MKNVAATNGQSVSFAALFFGDESTWEGIWAGTDMLLNFYDRPPQAPFALVTPRAVNKNRSKLATKEYKVCTRTQQKNALNREFLHAGIRSQLM
jgi:hypothetical protein